MKISNAIFRRHTDQCQKPRVCSKKFVQHLNTSKGTLGSIIAPHQRNSLRVCMPSRTNVFKHSPRTRSSKRPHLTNIVLRWKQHSCCMGDLRCPNDARSVLGLREHGTFAQPRRKVPKNCPATAQAPSQSAERYTAGGRARTPLASFFNRPIM